MEDAGRWALARRDNAAPDGRTVGAEAIEHAARTLLLRYGVVFWRLLEREAAWLPPWRDLLRVYRRMEARGEIRGGRFVAGFSGEQFALPDAIGLLRETRRRRRLRAVGFAVRRRSAESRGHPDAGAEARRRSPAIALLYRNGLPIASLAGGETHFYETLDAAAEWQAQKALLRGASPPAPAELAPA